MQTLQNRPLTVKEASEYLGYSPSYLYKLIHLKQIPHYKPTGSKVVFKLEDLEAYAFRNRKSASYELQEQAEAILTGGEV